MIYPKELDEFFSDELAYYLTSIDFNLSCGFLMIAIITAKTFSIIDESLKNPLDKIFDLYGEKK